MQGTIEVNCPGCNYQSKQALSLRSDTSQPKNSIRCGNCGMIITLPRIQGPGSTRLRSTKHEYKPTVSPLLSSSTHFARSTGSACLDAGSPKANDFESDIAVSPAKRFITETVPVPHLSPLQPKQTTSNKGLTARLRQKATHFFKEAGHQLRNSKASP